MTSLPAKFLGYVLATIGVAIVVAGAGYRIGQAVGVWP